MSIASDKIMNLADGQVLYNDMRDRHEEAVNGWYGNAADRILSAVEDIAGIYNFDDVANIVAAIRNGNIDKVPNGTVFKVPHSVYGDVYFVTRAKNMHKVAGDPSRPTITIQALYLLSSNGGTSAATFQYDRPEGFAKATEAIPANTVVKFTAPSISSWAAGTYHFTATSQVAAGSILGLSGDYGTALTSLKVNVYASAKATTASAQYSIEAGDGDATVNLGTIGTDLNHPHRISYGSNNEAQSNLFQWLNADSGAANMDSVFVPQTDFDLMDTSFTGKKGFLGGFSNEFRSYLGLCAIPNITNAVYETNGYTADGKNYAHNGYFFLPSRKEIYGSNETTYESGETQFDYYKEIATGNSDKLMKAKNASGATTYWLRTPVASDAYVVRVCSAGNGGALYSTHAFRSHGVAPLAILA